MKTDPVTLYKTDRAKFEKYVASLRGQAHSEDEEDDQEEIRRQQEKKAKKEKKSKKTKKDDKHVKQE